MENEDSAKEFLEELDNIINQAHNELDNDNSVSQSTLEELEIGVTESIDVRNKLELGSTIDTQIRFRVERAQHILDNS
jgi:ArsR family metal-binding transcriptional regulator